MNYIDSSTMYINSVSDARARITRIDAIIDGLMDSALVAVQSGHINEYFLDDKQTVIKCSYRNASEIMKDIQAYEQLKGLYARRINGSKFTLVDSRSVNRWR